MNWIMKALLHLFTTIPSLVEETNKQEKQYFSDPSHCHPTAAYGNTYPSDAHKSPILPVGNKKNDFKNCAIGDDVTGRIRISLIK